MKQGRFFIVLAAVIVLLLATYFYWNRSKDLIVYSIHDIALVSAVKDDTPSLDSLEKRMSLRTLNWSRGVLFRYKNQSEAYKYSKWTGKVSRVSASIWDKQNSPIVDCRNPGGKLYPIGSDSKVYFKDNEITQESIDGKLHLVAEGNQRGDKVHIISANGEKIHSGGSKVPPFAGEGYTVQGPHFSQIFSYPEGKQISDSFSLPIISERSPFLPCWSVDDKYIVYEQLGEFMVLETGVR